MVKSFEQALSIQTRRKNLGKRGYAKSVRRFILKTDPENYSQIMQCMPVTWLETKKTI